MFCFGMGSKGGVQGRRRRCLCVCFLRGFGVAEGTNFAVLQLWPDEAKGLRLGWSGYFVVHAGGAGGARRGVNFSPGGGKGSRF